ncbi:MAG: polysaccharide biosynthesis/export family protein [Planctomycetota bacterium]
MTRLAVTLTLATVLVVGCTNGPNSRYEEFGDRVNTEGFGHRFAQPEDGRGDLVMGPGDTIRIDVARNPELSSEQTIRYEGVIRMPYVGDVVVAGLTPAQIRDKLLLLMAPFIREAVIDVTPTRITSKNVYLFSTDQTGSIVARKLPVGGDMTLIDLVTVIGGTPTGVDDCNIKILRADPRHPKPLVVNLRDMVVNGYTAANIRLLPDDMVWFPPTFFYAVAQTINQVTFPLRELRRALRDGDDLRYFIENGEVRTRRGGF